MDRTLTIRTRAGKTSRTLLSGFLLLASQDAHAAVFCDHLKIIVNSAPNFDALRGESAGNGFRGLASIAQSQSCAVVPQTDANGKAIAGAWEYDCDWNNRYAQSVPWLKQQIKTCYPDAPFTDAADAGVKGASGGFFTTGKVGIFYLFDPMTRRLSLHVNIPFQ